jgi:hypothetical protein
MSPSIAENNCAHCSRLTLTGWQDFDPGVSIAHSVVRFAFSLFADWLNGPAKPLILSCRLKRVMKVSRRGIPFAAARYDGSQRLSYIFSFYSK